MKIKTSELTGAALDWAVMSIIYPVNSLGFFAQRHSGGKFRYSSDWAQGGPIIEREGMGIDQDQDGIWFASYDLSAEVAWGATGPTPLVAAMRCFVASKLGDEVEVPEELQ